jgi:hypothetical protein
LPTSEGGLRDIQPAPALSVRFRFTSAVVPKRVPRSFRRPGRRCALRWRSA